jgi:hypothetical protein
MNVIIPTIISSAFTLIAALLGFWSSYLIQKRGQKQILIDSILGKRVTTYSEALGLIYDIEQNQTKADELDGIDERWKKWYKSNAAFLPPSVNDTIFGAMTWARLVSVDLHNQDVDRETFRGFKERLQEAKTQLMGLKDIGWLPKDLE